MHYILTPFKNICIVIILLLENLVRNYSFFFQEGKDRHFKLGQLNRERYEGFLSESYDPDEIYVRSSDVDRTLMSAQCHLAGLYPPTNQTNQTWNPDLIWQPIPVHTIPKDDGQSTELVI